MTSNEVSYGTVVSYADCFLHKSHLDYDSDRLWVVN